ncbi:hypothetical protein I551_1976 [Mycobacterium ulcerans str. Harvey]|uniref:Alpha/beta hydrolase family protein n=1 Tax=Mycobacterium ulcerans str. Harvey TaxID=1299332 RepID=A0ABP3AK52_MYCUL|nr:hypothetical protein I551_1976 [Mycobacterium ulcerans str. Harvey]
MRERPRRVPKAWTPLSALSLRQRLVVESSAVRDIALRTYASSLLSTTVAPAVVAHALRRLDSGGERANLNFYAELAAEQDPRKSFPAPPNCPGFGPPASPLAEWIAVAASTTSLSPALSRENPNMRQHWSALTSNNVVRAQHWRTTTATAHPVRHSWLHGVVVLAQRTVFLPAVVYRSGYDVLLYTLPFHGKRAERFSPFSGFGFFASGLSGFAESMAQAVYDFRSIVDYLHHTGVTRIALTGISLGGYTSALVSSSKTG